jgi:hypothetical protein
VITEAKRKRNAGEMPEIDFLNTEVEEVEDNGTDELEKSAEENAGDENNSDKQDKWINFL